MKIIDCLKRLTKEKSKPEYVLLVIFPGRRPIRKAYQLGENWYAHENDFLSDWRIKLLPDGKVEGGSNIIEAWEPVSQKMIEFYHYKINNNESLLINH